MDVLVDLLDTLVILSIFFTGCSDLLFFGELEVLLVTRVLFATLFSSYTNSTGFFLVRFLGLTW